MIQLTDYIILKPISTDVVSDIFSTIDSEREYLRKWLPFVDSTISESGSLAFVTETIKTEQVVFSIHENQELIGLIGFNNLDTKNRKAEIGYWLSEKKQGKGIITLAVRKLLIFAFTSLNLNSVRILVATNNTKSRNIPERIGFTLEGIIREGEMLVNNKFTDLAIYSLLKKEYIV